MKSTCLLSVIFCIALFSSCHKSEEVIAPGLNKPKGTLSFVFDTKSVVATDAVAYYEWDSVKKISQMYIVGYNNVLHQNPKDIYIGLDDNPQSRGSIKPYGISPFIKAGFSHSMMGDSTIYSSIAGSITITRFDTLRKYVSGTFEGFAVRESRGMVRYGWHNTIPYNGDTLQVRSGKFDLPLKVRYTEYPHQ